MQQQMGRRLKELREAQGWNQVQLAAASGVSVATVSLIEAGQRTPNAETIVKLAGALGVGPGALFPKDQPSLFNNTEQRREEEEGERRDQEIRDLLAQARGGNSELGLPQDEFDQLLESVPQRAADELVGLAVRTKAEHVAVLDFVQHKIDAGMPVLERIFLQRNQARIVERRMILILAILAEFEQRKDYANRRKVEEAA